MKTIKISDETWEQIKNVVEKEKEEKKTTIYKKNGDVLYESYKKTVKEAVVEAVNNDVDLSCADLSGANLSCADLSGADLSGANLYGADLSNTKTKYCKVNFSQSEYKQAKQFIEGLK